jgi:hypothetical protein
MASKYELMRIPNISPKPIQSIGTYVSLDAECVVAGSTDKNLRFLDIDDLDELARCTGDCAPIPYTLYAIRYILYAICYLLSAIRYTLYAICCISLN